MKKLIILFLLFILVLNPVIAQDEEEEDNGWFAEMLSDALETLPNLFYDFIITIINSPIQPLLDAVQDLLTTDVSIDLFYYVWSIIRYIISFFYIFLFIYTGFVFLTSNANPIKRAYAKDMLRNIVIMIVLIQASFMLYDLVLQLSSLLNTTILDMIDPTFFQFTADNIVNIGLQFVYGGSYVIMLLVALFLLLLRYVAVCFGVVILPIAIFCYFIPPLKAYGKFMIHALLLFVFITFIDLLIILGCSMLVSTPLFDNFEIVIMVTCFGMVNYSLFLVISFAMKMAVSSSIKDDLNQAVKYIALAAA